MRRHSTESADEDPDRPQAADPLPPELERRIDVLEGDGAAARDFDRRSWLWLVLLGIVLPLVLLILGWSL